MNYLVIQAIDLHEYSLPKTRAFFSQHQMPISITHTPHTVWRIDVPADFVLPEDLSREWHEARADFAVLPKRPFSDIKLIVSDMDSTLINIECIDEIAAGAGLKAQVAHITELAMRGEMDFAESLRRRVALLKGLPESHLQSVYDHVLKLDSGAEYLLQQCHKHNIRFVLVSGGFTFFTEKLKTRLNFEHAYANVLAIKNGVLTGEIIGDVIDSQAKADILRQHQNDLGCRADQIIAVGDGANDIPMLQAAGFGIAYHAKPKTQQYADLCIHYNNLSALRTWFLP